MDYKQEHSVNMNVYSPKASCSPNGPAFSFRLIRLSVNLYLIRNNNLQGGTTNERCGRVVLQGVSDDQERDLIVDLHNQLRAKIANGQELRGDPGPQPMAANMMELVSIIGTISNYYAFLASGFRLQ